MSATSTERLVLGIVLGVVALAALLSIALTLTSRTAVAAARIGTTNVQMKNYAFGPNTLQVKADDRVRLVVKNADSTLHTFTMPQAGVNVSVLPGSEKLIEFKAPQGNCILLSAGGQDLQQVPVAPASAQTLRFDADFGRSFLP